MGVFYTPSNATGLPDGFYGSAKLHSDAADIVVVIASQRYLASGAQGWLMKVRFPPMRLPVSAFQLYITAHPGKRVSIS